MLVCFVNDANLTKLQSQSVFSQENRSRVNSLADAPYKKGVVSPPMDFPYSVTLALTVTAAAK